MSGMSDTSRLVERVSFRAPAGLHERLATLGRVFGRGACEEIRLALSTHQCRATLRWLATPEAAQELGDRLDAARAGVLAELEALEATAFDRPTLHPRMK